ADLALCNYLAFWCGPDEKRIADLFAQSGLFRSKWQRDDYRKRTIDKAMAGRTEFYRPRQKPRMDGQAAASPDRFSNYYEIENVEKGGDNKPKTVTSRVGLPVGAIGDTLLQITDGWPKRVGPLLFVPGAEYQPLYLQSADQL